MHQLSSQTTVNKKGTSIEACKNTQPSQTIVHAKLEMTTPGDYDEKEADAMADTVVNGGTIRREISNGSSGGGVAVSTAMESQLAQAKGGGRTMPDGLQNMMESGFGRNFSNVRIHTDSQAEAMNNSLSAKAFTLGNDIYFNKGQFSPNTREGQHLMAHELTHVVQGTGKVGREPNGKLYGPDNLPKLDRGILLAKKMIDNSISVLDHIKNGKYTGLFTYCFNTKIVKQEDVDIVISNYEKMKNGINNVTISGISNLMYLGKIVDGLTVNYYNKKDMENPNTISINSNIYNPSYEWADQLYLATCIIHELSHNLCGTSDITYFEKQDNRTEVFIHGVNKKFKKSKIDTEVREKKRSLLNNASSYGIFSQWVESTIYSAFDDKYVEKKEGKWSRDDYKTFLYNGNPTRG